MSSSPTDPSAQSQASWSDQRLDLVIGMLLRIGVLAAAGLVLAGGFFYLLQRGQEPSPDYHTFHPAVEQAAPSHVFEEARHLHGTGLLALGLLLLIATPVARVAISTVAFLIERDLLYALITLIVLAILLFSLFHGYAA